MQDDPREYIRWINSARVELNRIAKHGHGLTEMQVWMETYLTPEGWALYVGEK